MRKNIQTTVRTVLTTPKIPVVKKPIDGEKKKRISHSSLSRDRERGMVYSPALVPTTPIDLNTVGL